MRIRTFALPLIATVVGAGAAVFHTKGPLLPVPWEATESIALILGLLFVVAVRMAIRLPRSERLQAQREERFFLWLLPISFAIGAAIIVWQQPGSFSFPVLVLISGAMVLFLIYLLDRFYYTALLLAAVIRAEEIEVELDFKLTRKITEMVESPTYTLLPALVYLVPTLVLVNLGLVTAAFTAKTP